VVGVCHDDSRLARTVYIMSQQAELPRVKPDPVSSSAYAGDPVIAGQDLNRKLEVTGYPLSRVRQALLRHNDIL
jgi:hypothetical protein